MLPPESAAIAFSHSGRTLETLQALEAAAGHGATTIAVTNDPASPLAESAAVVIGTVARDTRFRSGAMASRIAQLAIADFLFVRVAQRGYGEALTSLERTSRAVRRHRVDDP